MPEEIDEPKSELKTPTRYHRDFPSDRYLEALLWSRRHHRENKTFNGTRSFHSYPTLYTLCKHYDVRTILDFGSGKGQHYGVPFTCERVSYDSLEMALGVEFYPYDPAWEPYSVMPSTDVFTTYGLKKCYVFGGVLCNDVLQYIPADDQDWVIKDIFTRASRFALLCVSCEQGKKPWGDSDIGDKVRPVDWWVGNVKNAMKSSVLLPDAVVLRIRGFDPARSKKCGIWLAERSSNWDLRFVGIDNLVLVNGQLTARMVEGQGLASDTSADKDKEG